MVVDVGDAAGSAAGTGRPMGLADVKSWSVHLLHGCGASVVPQGDALGGAAGSVMVLESSWLGCCSYSSKAPSGARMLGNPAAVKRF